MPCTIRRCFCGSMSGMPFVWSIRKGTEGVMIPSSSRSGVISEGVGDGGWPGCGPADDMASELGRLAIGEEALGLVGRRRRLPAHRLDGAHHECGERATARQKAPAIRTGVGTHKQVLLHPGL